VILHKYQKFTKLESPVTKECDFDSNKKESIYLDGEIYKHGKSLQNFSSDLRQIQFQKITSKFAVIHLNWI